MVAQITLMRTLGALLSKRIALNIEGKPVADGSACKMQAGTAFTTPAPDAATLAWKIDTLTSAEAVVLGSIKDVEVDRTVNVITANAVKKCPPAQRVNTISRTRECIPFRPREMAWMLLDFDTKAAPASVLSAITVAGGVFPALLTVEPGLERAARVARASTSTGLYHKDTSERYEGSGGEHVYVLVKDGADIDRALQAFHARAWLHQFGWLMLGAAGQFLDRSLIDQSVRYPERLCFEGPPEIVPPLAQDLTLRACSPTEGAALDTRAMIPDLTASERQQVEDLKVAMRRVLEPQAQTVRAAFDNALATTIVKREGVPFATALRRVAAFRRGTLTPSITLVTDDLGDILVRDILLDPQRYIGDALCDPYEGANYGYSKALIMESQFEPGRVFIHSFAHGGATYDLKHDANSAAEVLNAAPVRGIADTLCEVVAASDIEPEEVDQLIDIVVAKTKPPLKRMPLKKRLREDQERRAQLRRQAAATSRQAPVDQRIRRIVPPADGEVGPVVAEVDRVLADNDTESPPMRRPDGTLVELRTQSPFNLHQLVANGSNAAAVDSGQLPAPPEPLLVRMTPVTVGGMVEKHFVWEKRDHNGVFLYNAQLPAPFINAFMQMPGSVSKLPHVNAINTAPMVAENGAIIDGFGLDRNSGIYHLIEPGLRDCLPKADVTEDDVRNAVNWLCDQWLIDVLTDKTGKLTFLNMAITHIERFLLALRPAFAITAGLQGGGKTTLAHMLIMALFGRMASAVSWSENQEERRKAMFAHYRQGISSLPWDNMKNGTEIACPEVEKSCTSPTIQDRILGLSQGEAVPTHAPHIFIGNNIKFAGDMATRGVMIRLRTDNPHPEDRSVQHADPIAWTYDRRAEIMRRLYTIMVFGCRNRPAGQIAKTRFKSWWSVAGWPVELAASLIGTQLDFTEVIRASGAQDSKAAGVANAVRLLMTTFGTEWFRVRDIGQILDKGDRAREVLRHSVGAAAATAAEDAVRLATAFLEMIEELTGRRDRKPISSVIGRVLGGIADRPVELEDAARGIIRARTLHGNVELRVEVLGKSNGTNCSNHPQDRPAGGALPHPIPVRYGTIYQRVGQMPHPAIGSRPWTKFFLMLHLLTRMQLRIVRLS